MKGCLVSWFLDLGSVGCESARRGAKIDFTNDRLCISTWAIHQADRKRVELVNTGAGVLLRTAAPWPGGKA